jgi:hypothetical protein
MRQAFFLLLALAISACSQVDREALAFPDMPQMPFYHRIDGKRLSADDSIDALQDAETACRQNSQGGTSITVGTPSFDSCMHRQGYNRTR